MMARCRTWWRLRTRREQGLLRIAGALVAAMVLWFGMVRPIDKALVHAKTRRARAELALADARAQAGAIHRLQRIPPPALPAPFPLFIGRLAEDAGFTVARIAPQGSRQVNIVITAARAPALFAWTTALERRYGLIVDRLSASANSDATVAVEMSIRARSR